MEIERNYYNKKIIPKRTLEEFADEHGLILEINERSPESIAMSHIGESGRFYARFKGAEEKDGILLKGTFGNGSTELKAVNHYINKISEKLLVINAYNSETRKEIQTPKLYEMEKI